MAKENRIRIDMTGKDGVKITKTSIVEAVKLLEQRPNLSFKGSSRELIDFASSNMYVTRVSDLVTLGIVWNDKEQNSKVVKVEDKFEVKYNRIDNVPVPIELPKRIAELILKTGQVIVDSNSDEFK